MAGREGNASETLDKQNMDLVKTVANEIHQCMHTCDYRLPIKESENKMPILVLRIWLASMFDSVTQEMKATLLHEHYTKNVSSKAVIDARSAVPWKVKRTVLTQEVIRVLRNCR